MQLKADTRSQLDALRGSNESEAEAELEELQGRLSASEDIRTELSAHLAGANARYGSFVLWCVVVLGQSTWHVVGGGVQA